MSAELIRAYYEAFNRRDYEGMLALLTEDVTHDVNQGGCEQGRGAFGIFPGHMDRCYRERIRDLAVMVSEDGGRAAAEFVVDGTYLATDEGLPEAKGQTYSLPAGAFFEVVGGRIGRVTNYYNMKAWLRQVGA
jgi:steroid delta-isomerase-like uncharacterized protein